MSSNYIEFGAVAVVLPTVNLGNTRQMVYQNNPPPQKKKRQTFSKEKLILKTT